MILIKKKRSSRKIKCKESFDLFILINKLKIQAKSGDAFIYAKQLEKEALGLLHCHFALMKPIDILDDCDYFEKAQNHIFMIEIITMTFLELKIWNKKVGSQIILKFKSIAHELNEAATILH